ncbi:hypothetical protein FQN49_008093 [Arthroderma sp. PD_2]|nr:hypothetical protein FQN49_008093 [Arthroderma sp. PD_2]
MSSFFSSKPKSQVRISSQSNKNVSDGFGGFETRLSFSKMRKKRPPPINISVAGNVIITNATPSSSQMIYAELPWTASNPPTPRTITCSNPGCVAREAMPMMTSPVESQFKLANPCATCNCQPCNKSMPTNTPYCSPHHPYFSAAELPGSIMSPMSVELDAPTTPTRFTFDHSDEHLLDSPPNLSLSPRAETIPERQDGYSFGRLQETEPIRNGKLLSQMDYDELMGILPDLTPDEVKLHWHPAICRQPEIAKHKQSSPTSVTRSSTWSGRGSHSKEDPEQVRAECEIRLNSKENEITGLLRLHDSRIDSLCKFITEHLEDQLNSSDDASHQAVREIISTQQCRGKDHFDADLQHMHQSRQIQELQDHISKLEPVAIRNEKRARAYKLKVKSLREDIMASKEDEEQLKKELVEKDAYIDTLNNKVTQLLTMRPDPFPPSDIRGTGKHLPSPAPCDWKRAEELKHQVAV